MPSFPGTQNPLLFPILSYFKPQRSTTLLIGCVAKGGGVGGHFPQSSTSPTSPGSLDDLLKPSDRESTPERREQKRRTEGGESEFWKGGPEEVSNMVRRRGHPLKGPRFPGGSAKKRGNHEVQLLTGGVIEIGAGAAVGSLRVVLVPIPAGSHEEVFQQLDCQSAKKEKGGGETQGCQSQAGSMT